MRKNLNITMVLAACCVALVALPSLASAVVTPGVGVTARGFSLFSLESSSTETTLPALDPKPSKPTTVTPIPDPSIKWPTKNETIGYDGQSCVTCHSGNVHAEHRKSSCASCHSGISVSKTDTKSAPLWSIPGLSALPAATRSQTCGINEAACHSADVRGSDGPRNVGAVWHGWQPKRVAKAHEVGQPDSRQVGCLGSAGNAGCHRNGSVESPFYFGEMNLAAAHQDYAHAASEGRVNPDAEVSTVMAGGQGCAACHDKAADNRQKLKDFARETKAGSFTCVSCHNAKASYVPGDSQAANCFKTPYKDGAETVDSIVRSDLSSDIKAELGQGIVSLEPTLSAETTGAPDAQSLLAPYLSTMFRSPF